MRARYRYTIIIFGALFFCAAAPVLILYVSGKRYDRTHGKIVETGIIAIRTDPSDASVTVNGELKRKNDGDLTFMPSGEYTILLQKDGYRPWQKRLRVETGQVTWANPAPYRLSLIRNQPATTLASGVRDFVLLKNGSLVVLGQNSATFMDEKGVEQKTVPLPSGNLSFTPISDTEVLASGTSSAGSSNALVIDAARQSTSDYSKRFESVPWLHRDGSSLYALESGKLSELSGSSTVPIASDVAAAASYGGTLYYLKETTAGMADLLVREGSETARVMATKVPTTYPSQILVGSERQLFVRSGSQLYRVGGGATLLSDLTTEATLSDREQTLSFVHGGEVTRLDLGTQEQSLLTRSSQPLSDVHVIEPAGYAVFTRGSDLVAAEFDTRERQNEYILATGDIEKTAVDKAGEYVFVLASGTLSSIRIR